MIIWLPYSPVVREASKVEVSVSILDQNKYLFKKYEYSLSNVEYFIFSIYRFLFLTWYS